MNITVRASQLFGWIEESGTRVPVLWGCMDRQMLADLREVSRGTGEG